jgi:mannose-6-phosphate isomerase
LSLISQHPTDPPLQRARRPPPSKGPSKFTDANHKPEIAVALSTFEVFAGWKPLNDIQALFQLKPLRRFFPDKTAHFNNDTLRSVTQAILTAPDDVVEETQNAIATIPREEYADQSHILDPLPRLQQQYSIKDQSNLTALLCMNYMVLSAGESIYIPADGIHAYLSGDIMECMARSNDVLNTGFCPRADRDDIELFSSSLTFNPHSVEKMLLRSTPSPKGRNGKTVVYAPPLSEFNMLVTVLQQGEREVCQQRRDIQEQITNLSLRPSQLPGARWL